VVSVSVSHGCEPFQPDGVGLAIFEIAHPFRTVSTAHSDRSSSLALRKARFCARQECDVMYRRDPLPARRRDGRIQPRVSTFGNHPNK
jgi:hypothetical protein